MQRFGPDPDKTVAFLLDLKWWDWQPEKIYNNLDALCSGDISKIKSI